MHIYLGGYLNFYHPKKGKWLVVELDRPTPLAELLDHAHIPLEEVQLVAINGEVVELQAAVISEGDDVKVFSAVGGG